MAARPGKQKPAAAAAKPSPPAGERGSDVDYYRKAFPIFGKPLVWWVALIMIVVGGPYLFYSAAKWTKDSETMTSESFAAAYKLIEAWGHLVEKNWTLASDVEGARRTASFLQSRLAPGPFVASPTPLEQLKIKSPFFGHTKLGGYDDEYTEDEASDDAYLLLKMLQSWSPITQEFGEKAPHPHVHDVIVSAPLEDEYGWYIALEGECDLLWTNSYGSKRMLSFVVNGKLRPGEEVNVKKKKKYSFRLYESRFSAQLKNRN